MLSCSGLPSLTSCLDYLHATRHSGGGDTSRPQAGKYTHQWRYVSCKAVWLWAVPGQTFGRGGARANIGRVAHHPRDCEWRVWDVALRYAYPELKFAVERDHPFSPFMKPHSCQPSGHEMVSCTRGPAGILGLFSLDRRVEHGMHFGGADQAEASDARNVDHGPIETHVCIFGRPSTRGVVVRDAA